MTSSPRQQGLFDLDDAAGLPVAVAGSSRQLNPAQKEFNRLSAQLEAHRKALESLFGEADRLRQRWSEEAGPLLAAVDRAKRALIRRLDVLLQRPPPGLTLKRRERAILVRYLLDLIENRFENSDSGDNAALASIFDRHSEISLAEMRAEEDMAFRSGLEAFADQFGVEIDGDCDDDTLQERIAAAAREQAAAQAAEQTQRAERRRKARPDKATQAARRREEALRDAGQSLREVFRRLASALHPDREGDPAEKARKTALMQQANQAYEANDLMSLLRLQVEADQLDPDRLAVMPEQRLRGYNLLLKEQIATVKARIEQVQTELRQAFGGPFAFSRGFQVSLLDHSIDQGLVELRAVEEKHRHDHDTLGEPASVRALIRDLQREEKEILRAQNQELGVIIEILTGDLPAAPHGKPVKSSQQGRRGK